jgi:hypothetical protein
MSIFSLLWVGILLLQIKSGLRVNVRNQLGTMEYHFRS